MAKPKAADAATVRARVLVDFATYGLKVGHIFVAEKSVIDEMTAIGAVDADPAAVAYAEEQGAEVVTQPDA